MFTKTYSIVALDNGSLVTEEFTGNYFQMSSRLTAIRNQGCPIQSVTKH
jgi:hypothetical protein